MNLLKSISAAATVLMIAGCESEQAFVPGSNMPEIRLETAVNSYTRAQGLDFETGDNFGLFLIAYEGETAPEFGTEFFRRNLMCAKTESGVSLTRIYYPAKGKVDFYAYYPYAVIIPPSDKPQELTHSVSANQTDRLHYKNSDFLTAVVRGITPTRDAVPLTFSHRMSLVNVQLLPGQGMTAQDLKNARMTTGALASKCRVNIVTGAVSDPSGSISITPNGNQVSLEDEKVSQMSFIAVPQTIPAGTELFDIILGNLVTGTTHYKYVTDRDIVLESGYRYQMDITLRRAGSQVQACIAATPR